MRARVMATPSKARLPGEEMGGTELAGPEAAQAAALGVPGVEGALTGLEDSAQFAEELLRRYEAPYPLPWRHGGLNE